MLKHIVLARFLVPATSVDDDPHVIPPTTFENLLIRNQPSVQLTPIAEAATPHAVTPSSPYESATPEVEILASPLLRHNTRLTQHPHWHRDYVLNANSPTRYPLVNYVSYDSLSSPINASWGLFPMNLNLHPFTRLWRLRFVLWRITIHGLSRSCHKESR